MDIKEIEKALTKEDISPELKKQLELRLKALKNNKDILK